MKQMALVLTALILPTFVFAAEMSDSRWVLDSSTLTYKIVFPLHHPQGVSREGTGAGECATSGCTFTVSAPIKSFDSRNKKRDHDMIETMRGVQNPDVKVTAAFPGFPSEEGGKFKTNLVIEMSGEKANYSDVEFQLVTKSDQSLVVEGTIPMLLEDFKVVRPSLMGVKVKNLCPITVRTTWATAPILAE